MTWLRSHIHEHPYRLLGTMLVLVTLSWAAATVALVHSFNVAHHARVENCLALDELKRELHVAFTDLHYPSVAERFEANQRCEDLP